MWSTLAALEEQILDAPAPRTAEQGKDTVGEVFSLDSSDEVSSGEAEPGCVEQVGKRQSRR